MKNKFVFIKTQNDIVNEDKFKPKLKKYCKYQRHKITSTTFEQTYSWRATRYPIDDNTYV